MKSPPAFWTGTAIVVGTHLWLFTDIMPPALQKYHAGINLAGAALIVFGAM